LAGRGRPSATLCKQAHSDAFDESLTKAETSKLIDAMREKPAWRRAERRQTPSATTM
jgi:Protein of unknown function (DUF3072)